MQKLSLLALTAALALTGCVDSAETARPDHRVGVMRDENGRAIALSKDCPVWNQYPWDGLENHYRPEFGCADGYNLARMIDRPADLVEGRRPPSSEAATGVLGIERYREGKTKQLMNPKDNLSTTSEQ